MSAAFAVLLAAIAATAMHSTAGAASGLGGSAKATLAFTANVLAETEPCGCSGGRLGGLTRRAAFMDELATRFGSVLAVDGGDVFFGTYKLEGPQVDESRKPAMLLARTQHLLSKDAVAVGENDLAAGLARLEEVARESRVPLLCTNLRRASGEHPFDTSVVRQLGPARVGVFALLSRNLGVEQFHPEVLLEDPLVACRQTVSKLRSECDLVVLLAHLPKSETDELLRQVPGIDVAVQGHDVDRPKEPRMIGDCIVVEPGNRGQFVGHLDLSFVAGQETGPVQLIQKTRPTPPRPGHRFAVWEHVSTPITLEMGEQPAALEVVRASRAEPAPAPQPQAKSRPRAGSIVKQAPRTARPPRRREGG